MNSLNWYEKYISDKHWQKHTEEYAESFAKFLKKQNFKGLVIDIGCGNGRDANVLHRYGFKTMGIDCFEKDIRIARKKFPKIKFEVQDAEEMKFRENSVDAFYMVNVIHFLEKENAVKEVLRVLKPKGYLFIHFNLEIADEKGNVDYKDSKKNILRLFHKFDIINKRKLERIDNEPIRHKHKILELILQKK